MTSERDKSTGKFPKRPGKPARGNKHDGRVGPSIPASGIPASGAGWGGPASGSVYDEQPALSIAQFRALPPEERAAAIRDKRVRREAWLDIYAGIATDETRLPTERMMAVDKLLLQTGQDVPKRVVNLNINDPSGMSDEELAEGIARARARTIDRTAATAGEGEPHRVGNRRITGS